MFLDGCNGLRATLGFAHHGNQAGLGQHHLGEFVHACGGRGACGSNSFALHGVDWAHVVNDAVGEVDGQFFAFCQHVLNAFVSGIATRQHFAVEQQSLARFPAGHFCGGQGV